jgi:hypothetical protein
MNRPLVTDIEYQKEARKQTEWLNWVFAIVTFSLCIECLQFASPWRIAMMGLGLVVPMYVYAFLSFPPTLGALRKLRREIQNDPKQHQEVDALVKYFENRYHGWIAAFRLLPLWLALGIYLLILFSFAKPFSAILWFKA